ncbi:MAG: hypothetical protein JW870_07870 [Candidatus Delongbacteria bacterium]|nr:hypothetical protein [Candidatus Delongbacteria bacterium]
MKYILILSCLLLFDSCSVSNKISDDEIEKRAIKIAELYDSTNIDIFKTWGYTPRGQAGIWFKNVGDSSIYRCIFIDRIDSANLMVMQYDNFIKDFNLKITYDTAYWRVTMQKQENRLIKIIGVDNHGKDVLIMDNVPQDSIFTTENPFIKFKELTELKDSLKIFGIHYYENLGGFIQFHLSAQHLLTYVPNIDLLNPKFKQVWLNEFSKGKWISKHWNLRKLDKPMDLG